MSLKERTVKLKSIFTSLVEVLELSDPYTKGHSERVASLSVALGLELQLSTRELQILQDPECIRLMRDFIKARPELWNEDIGV